MEGIHFIDKDPNEYEALAELQKRDIQSMKVESEFEKIIRTFENLWNLRTEDFKMARELGYRQYIHAANFDEKGNPMVSKIDILAIKGIREKQRKYLVDIKNQIKEVNLDKKENEDGVNLITRVHNILKQVKDGYDNVRRHYNAYERVVNPTAIAQASSTSDPSTMCEEDTENIVPYQKCLIFALDELYKAKFRRYKGFCCEERKTEDGYNTRAWEQKMSINDFVYSLSNKDDNFEMWKNFTSKGQVIYRDVIDNLGKCQDSQFPTIEKRRYVWSFKNGVFIGKEWVGTNPLNKDDGYYRCAFYPYDSKEFARLDPTLIACKYFDQEFNDYSHIENWEDIPTPNFERVLQYQNFEPDVCKWAYVMGGRLCFDVGDLDKWQIIPFFKGIAKSGKSTLITKVFKKFYESQDVGTLSNNIEKKFGLSAIMDNFMFIAPEVKGDISLEQAEFQSIVSGEDVSIAVKNKQAIPMVWKVPGVLGGNEVPGWKDNSGSVLRRILPWNFSKQVREADPTLDDKLENELPIILLKCVRGYIDYRNKYADADIWNVVPKYFELIKMQVAKVANSLIHFLESTMVDKGKGEYVPQNLFVTAFNTHCKNNNLGQHKFHEDFYVGPFSSYDIEVRNESVSYRGRQYPKQPVIFGVDLKEDELVTGNNH